MDSTPPARTHKRVYQACEPCRVKKVRCELGLVDHPTKPPCARCRRESRECFFAAKRARKTPATTTERQGSQPNKRRATSPPAAPAHEPESSRPRIAAYLSPSASVPSSVPAVERPQNQAFSSSGDGRATAALLRGHPRTYHDALTLLSEACDHYDHRKTPNNASSRPADAQNNDVSPPPRARSPAATNPLGLETQQALRAWSSVRFVRGGLFTAEEALDMVDHFYNFQAPYSPIIPERFKDHGQHAVLIDEEPILTVTLLMIGSRYRKWTGPGALSRPYIVHDRLWRYLQGMISRLFWSEDNFVGEFTALADPFSGPGMESHNHSRPGTWSNGFRTLGTCEALLMLLDWHPQALHFPPVDEDTTSIVIREPKTPRRLAVSSSYCGPGSGHDWLARSDRMCRSMLSAASMLATEIGIFDEEDTPAIHGYESGHSLWEMPSDRQRAYRLRRLIWVYSTQQPGRPSWRILTPSPTRLGPGMEKDDTTECWFRVATLMKQANDLLFPSQKHTNEIIRNGEHTKILQGFQPLLQEWSIKFDQTKLTKQMRSILTIEYAYVRLCIFSVALQAVINRRYDAAGQDTGLPGNNSGIPQQEEHLTQTVKAAQTILRTVLDDLLADGYIKYIPVRSYSRILGAALFLLKCCAAGITEIDIPTSLHLVNRIAIGLRSSQIDDTHLGARWGDLLIRLSGGLQSRLIQPQNPTNTGSSLAPETTRPVDRSPFPDSSASSNPTHPPATRITSSNEPIQTRTPFEPNDFMDIYSASMDSGRYGHNSEAFSMWWDLLHPSQAVSGGDIPWYPNLGNIDGSEQLFHGVSDGGMQHGSSGFSGDLY